MLNFKTITMKNPTIKLNYKWICGSATLLATGLLIQDANTSVYMDWKPINYKRVKQLTMNNFVKEVLLYADTKDVKSYKSFLTIPVDVLSDKQYDGIIDTIMVNTILTKVNGLEDIIYILKTLKLIHDEVLLGKVDCIQICQSGLVLVRIENINNNLGKSAYIEINDVRLKIMKLLSRIQNTLKYSHVQPTFHQSSSMQYFSSGLRLRATGASEPTPPDLPWRPRRG